MYINWNGQGDNIECAVEIDLQRLKSADCWSHSKETSVGTGRHPAKLPGGVSVSPTSDTPSHHLKRFQSL